jgi:hypothetical protein
VIRVTEHAHQNLLASGPQPTLLPADPAAAELAGTGPGGSGGVPPGLGTAPERYVAIARAYPASSLSWALLAEEALRSGTPEADITAYAYARTGYHRGLDALRRAGWRGSGPIPWEHEPNRGFLRALYALSVAAGRIGETEEKQRCAQFLRDSTESGYRELTAPTGGVEASPGDSTAEVR